MYQKPLSTTNQVQVTTLPFQSHDTTGLSVSASKQLASFLTAEEAKACDSIVSALFEKIIEQCKILNSGGYFSINIGPVYDNFGAVAQVNILHKMKAQEFFAGREHKDAETFTELGIKEILLRPAVQRGRSGGLPQELLLNVSIGDEFFTGTLRLYVGIRRNR